MQNKLLLIFAFILALICSPGVFADEIIVTDADTIYNLRQVPVVISDIPGEPNVMVVKYADVIEYNLLNNATNISGIVGEPGVMVVKYADGIACNSLENATYVQQLSGEPDVMVVKYADTITSFINSPHPNFLNGTFLLKVESRPEVYWLQNDRLYQITDWDVINQMSGIPGWDNVNTYPANEFDPTEYTQDPGFINTSVESDNLLIREQGDIKVYLILGGEKHHFNSSEALAWKGYGFDDVINVSSSIIEMFPEGIPITIHDKQLLRKPGETDVYWYQNGKLYYVTFDALDKMQDIYGWGRDMMNEPADFNPEYFGQNKTFITTGPESNGILIRLLGDLKVYLIENGVRRHITCLDVMDLDGYVTEDAIDVSQDIIDMFPSGDPIGMEVNLSFSKMTYSGEEPYITEFIKFEDPS